MTCEILELDKDSVHWDDFYGISGYIYKKDSFYCKRSIESAKQELQPHRVNHKSRPFVALRNGRPAARLMTFIKSDLRGYRKGKIGLIGFFESENNQDTANQILDHAVGWFKKEGVDKVVGPMNGDTWHSYRFSLGPFDQPPFMMEPYNPGYYAALWENYGFSILSVYESKHVPDVSPVLSKLKPRYEKAVRNGFSFRSFDRSRYDDELNLLYDLICRIFSGNPFYTEIKREMFKRIYAGAKSIIDESLFWFCRDRDDRYAGFIFAFPDYFKALRSMNGKTSLFAKLRFILNKRKADTLNLKTVGTDHAYRGEGLGTALMYKAYFEGFKKGYKKANMCLFHRENVSGRIDGGKGEAMRTYHLYEYSIPLKKPEVF